MKQQEPTTLPMLDPSEETRLLAFDTEWGKLPEPTLHEHIRPGDPDSYVLELVRIDVERRLRRRMPISLTYYEQSVHATANRTELLANVEKILARQSQPAEVQLQSHYSGMQPWASGGLGQVYQSTDQELERPVALKVLQEKWCRSEHARHDFLMEARITSQLEHPGIVPIYQVGMTPEGQPCYSMRLIQGQTYRQAIEAYHRLPVTLLTERRLLLRRLLTHLAAVCRTIAYAHSKGVLHQDIKPENIMLGEFGEAIVLDWGLAQSSQLQQNEFRLSDEVEKTEYSSGIRGTLAYLSPEQASGDSSKVTFASDIFTLGATLYTLLSNRPPYQESSRINNLNLAVLADYPKPASLKSTPPALEAICLKAMARQPVDRYPTASEMADDLDRYLADEPVTAWREPWTVRLRRTVVRRKVLVSTLFSMLVIIPSALAIGSWLLTQEKTKTLLSEQRAQLKDQSAHQITEYLTRLFESADPITNVGNGFSADDEETRQQTAMVFLERGKQLVSEHLKDQPITKARLVLAMGRTYLSLGAFEQAKQLADESYQIFLQQYGKEDLDTAAALQLLGQVAQETGEYDKASTIYQEVLAIRKALRGADHLQVAETLFSMGTLAFHQPFSDKRPQFQSQSRVDAESMLLESLRIRRKLGPERHSDLGFTLLALASMNLSEPGGEMKAIGYATEAAFHLKQENSTRSLGTAFTSMIQGEYLRKNRKYAEAEKIYVSVLAQLRKSLGSRHPLTVLHMANLVGLVNASGDKPRALQLARELLEIIRPLAYFRSQPMVIEQMIYFSNVLFERGQYQEALDGLVEAKKFAEERPIGNEKNRVLLEQRLRATTMRLSISLLP